MCVTLGAVSLVLPVLGHLVAFAFCGLVVFQQLSYAHPSPTHNMLGFLDDMR